MLQPTRWISLTFCLFATNAIAGVIVGQVVDESGVPLPGANVAVESTDHETGADRNGRYRLGDVPAGQQTVVVVFSGYESARATVDVTAKETSVQDFVLGRQAMDLSIPEEIVVVGQLGILRELERKHGAETIMDVLSMETIEKLPVHSMTEALDRLPGVHIQSQVAGREFRNSYVVVRGIQPNLNSVTVMGMPLVSTTGERGVALDVLPAAMASQVEVVKALTPDMYANGIGGAINIVPLSAFDRKGTFFYSEVQAGAREEVGTLTGDELPLNVSSVGSMRIGSDWGIAATANFMRESHSRILVGPDDWEAIPQAGFPDDLLVPEGTRLAQMRSSYERWSGAVTIDWNPKPEHSVRLLASYTDTTDDQVSSQSEWNYADGKDEIPFELRSNNLIFTPVGENQKEFDIGDQSEQLFFVLGRGEFRFNPLTWTVRAGFVRGELQEEDNQWEFVSGNLPAVIDVSGELPWALPEDPAAFFDPSNYTFSELAIRPVDRTSESVILATDLRYDVEALGPEGFVKTGLFYSPRETVSDVTETVYAFNEDSDFTDISIGGLGVGMAVDPVRGLPLSPVISAEEIVPFRANNPDFFVPNGVNEIEGDYEVDEDVLAGYAMASASIGQLDLSGGLRFVHTQSESHFKSLNENTETISGEVVSNDYTNYLPNLHARFRFSDELQMRMAATYTIARPKLSDLAGSRFIQFDSSDVIGPGHVSDADIVQSTPTLDPFEALNLDATLEYYPRRGSLYMIGAFYKRIDNPIFVQSLEQHDVVIAGTQFDQVNFETPLNAESGSILGVEAQLQQTFTFLPAPLNGLGVTANIVFMNSEFVVPGRADEDLPFFQQPDAVLSITPFFTWGGLDVRVAYQYTNEYVNEFGSDTTKDNYIAERDSIDAQLSYNFDDRYTAFLSVKNLTNEPFWGYQGDPSRTNNYIEIGTAYWLGFRMQL